MHIVFRADASIEIGTGHVMRCLTLADALKERGAACHFICREHAGNLIELVKSKGHGVTALPVLANLSTDQTPVLAHAEWLGTTQEQDSQQTVSAIQALRQAIDWIVVDHYALDYRWEERLAAHTKKVLVVDDLADRKHQCNILLDQNFGKKTEDYQKLVPENCTLLLGTKYALLQPQYAELHPRTPPRQAPIKNILIYFGGSDKYDLTGMATQACLQLDRPGIQLNVVMGSSYLYREKLEQLEQKHSNLQLHQNLPSLARLMLQADLAIGAGGSTSWERCCLGLPALIFAIADNQKYGAQILHNIGVVQLLRAVDSISLIQNSLLSIDSDTLYLMSTKAKKIVDGLGAKRVTGLIFRSKL